MSEIVFLLEEPSAKVMLEALLPRILPSTVSCRYIVFQGKQDLEKQMTRKIRGYRVPSARFVVLRDKDAEDCVAVKERLVAKCEEAGCSNRCLVRIACHELESWYLGDLAAVDSGLGMGRLAKLQNKKPYNNPDDLASPAKRLQSIAPSYQKVGGSRAIGPHLDINRNLSHSFRVFVEGLRRLVRTNQPV
jgi:hypothetical protein